MARKLNIPNDKNILKTPIEEAMPENYLPYAVEVAKDRALPDVRDGLKPVHRRIIYGAYKLLAFPEKPYYKSARIVGDILGKYHPHGDSSVYDAMVILAQNFTTRKPLIDGHGNWGSQDGDSAAAMRYTEAKLTPIAMEMIKDIDKGVVNMVDNYSGSEKEPEVLPARYPNILVNGAFGIAVGIATNIPPHNLGEVIDGCLAYIEDNHIDTEGLMKYIKGPDLPTGGVLIGKNSLKSAYENGTGKVTLRAKTKIETLDNGKMAIVINEFPYRRNKSKILQNISDMTADKKHSKILDAISDIRDESDRKGIRAVIEFKKSIDKDMVSKVLKYLYKKTELQCNVSFNMVAIANGKPETLSLKAIIKYYIIHQKEVVTKRTKFQLEIAKKRFHIVEGFIKAIGIMDKIIATIRSSKSKKEAKKNLMDKYKFSDVQTEAILQLMLYKLTGLEIKSFEKEYKELEKNIKKLEKILESEKELLKVIKDELRKIKEKYNDERRTMLIDDDSEAKIELEDFIVEEDVVITVSNEGFTKRIASKSYKRSSGNLEDIEYREGDFNRFFINSNTKDILMVFTDKGNMYQTKVVNLPEGKWKEKGERLEEIIKGINFKKENIINIYSIDNIAAQKDFIFITSSGFIKKTNLDKYDTNYSRYMALKMKKEDKLIYAELVPRDREEKFVKIKTELGLEFTLEEPKLISSDRNILPISMINMGNKDFIKSVNIVEQGEFKEFTLKWDKNSRIKQLKNIKRSMKQGNITTNNLDELLIFLNDGEVIKINSVIFANMQNKIITLEELMGDYYKNKQILNIMSISDKDINEIYFFSKKGLVKKTFVEEIFSESLSWRVYKFRQNDELINIKFSNKQENEDIILVTKKGRGIRFDKNDVNSMGKLASGVTGINIKEDDEVIGSFISGEYDKEILLTTKNSKSETINIGDLKKQNRAGKGNSLINLNEDDYIKDISLKE